MQKLTILWGLIALACAIVSARLGIPPVAYGVVVCTLVVVALCVEGGIDYKYVPYLVYLIGLAFLYQTTLISDNLIGTDIHTEYFIYQHSLNGWDINYPHSYNTAIGSTIIAPFLTNYLGISGYVIYKYLYPALFAIVPVILYFIYRKEFDEKVALLSCMLFVTVPTYLLEMIGLPRQMLAEIMLALMMLLIILIPYRKRYLAPILLTVCLLGYALHYVIAPLITCFILGVLIVLLSIKLIRRWWHSLPVVKMSFVVLAIVLILPVLAGVYYYTYTGGGVVADNISGIFTWFKEMPERETKLLVDISNANVVFDDPSFMGRQEPLVRTAVGLDFFDVDWVGKLFRVFQYLIQLCLVIGCVWLVITKKKPSAEFISFTVASIVMLLACVFLPRFSNIINATRFYHIALFILSPLIVVGAVKMLRNYKIAVVCLFVPYILLTTGVVFEAAQEDDISRVNAPYSIAMSNYRIGAVAEYIDSDKEVADYIVENELEPILTDIQGMLLLSQSKDPYEYINRSPRTGKYYKVVLMGETNEGVAIEDLKEGWGYLPQYISELPEGVYIYLTDYSTRTQTVTFKPQWYDLQDTVSGMRQHYSYSQIGLLGNTTIVYQSGNSILLETNSVIQ